MNEKKGSGSVYAWYCPNCGNKLVGTMDSEGLIKKKCRVCQAVSVRKVMSRRCNRIDVYPAKGEETIPA